MPLRCISPIGFATQRRVTFKCQNRVNFKRSLTFASRNDADDDEFVMDELARIASDRFGDGSEFNLEALHFWGLLWLLLGAVDEAEKAATAILAFPLRSHDRGYKILALKLLAKVAGSRRLSPALAEFTASVYRQLWPGYAPHEERPDRQKVDEMLEQSMSPIL